MYVRSNPSESNCAANAPAYLITAVRQLIWLSVTEGVLLDLVSCTKWNRQDMSFFPRRREAHVVFVQLRSLLDLR